MGKEKFIITEENLPEWLSSLGHLFPENKRELARFEKLYADYPYVLNEDCVDPFAIVNGDFKPKRIEINEPEAGENDISLAARNLEGLPGHILDKVKKNQHGLDPKETGSTEGED
jgi:hypothetical protein